MEFLGQKIRIVVGDWKDANRFITIKYKPYAAYGFNIEDHSFAYVWKTIFNLLLMEKYGLRIR